MTSFSGKTVVPAIAIGKIAVYSRPDRQVKRYRAEDPEAEIARFAAARNQAAEQLRALYDKALGEVGEAEAQIFEIHQMMLDDPDYVEAVENAIRQQGVNAEYALAATADNFADMFAAMDDAYMRARSADVRDISERVLRILGGQDAHMTRFDEPVILFAEDLAPSETVQLDKEKVLGFVTRRGSVNSHTAILARTMNVPAIIGVDAEITDSLNGTLCVVDGVEGKIYLEPDDDLLQEMRARQTAEGERRRLLQRQRGRESVTLDGQRVLLYANIGGEGDLGAVLANDAEGIGLFRSEFLYLEKTDYPTEEEQFSVYRKVLETMGGKRVIIRTLDIGADKQIDYFGLDEEENPALGYRALRICLDRPEVFKTQLRALYRASAFGRLGIMVPMVISVAEVRAVKALAAEVREELRTEGAAVSENVELGIMIETPAAAIISDKLAPEVDFFSIGTNDLTQYLLACDRQNPKLDGINDPHHLAVLRTIRTVCDSAHRAGIWCGICGELGANPELTALFLAMGIDELSVTPSAVLGLRETVRETDISAVGPGLLAELD